MVLAAVQQDDGALSFASEALRADRRLVLTAVQQCGRAWHAAWHALPEALRADMGVALAAVR